MLDVHRLRLLRELSHRGTLAAVASALAYSPSAVSQQLSKLQAEVGVPLLEPVGRGVRLTPQARMLVTHTEAVIERLERAEAELAASAGDVTGTISVAAFQSVALGWIPHVLSLIGQRHTGLRLEITVREPGDALPRLLAGDFDLIVDEEYPGSAITRDSRLDRDQVTEDPITLVVPESWSRVDDIRDLAHAPWAFEPPGTMAHDWSVALCRLAGFEPDVEFSFDDLGMRLRFVQTGHAAALLPELAGARSTAGVRVLDLDGGPARRISTLVRVGTAKHPAVIALRAALRDVAGPDRP